MAGKREAGQALMASNDSMPASTSQDLVQAAVMNGAAAMAVPARGATHPPAFAGSSASSPSSGTPSTSGSIFMAAVASSSSSGSNASIHHTVVPAYPYNVSMSPFIPGTSSNRTDSYFEQHVPDDSNVQTRLPSICVDYLSHDWQEDDVWTSWKAMTKHKSEIANGVRLENASWRTWAKQRGRLKTISPETLNWLKDSDVTWLYGPLHTAVEPVPIKKAATAEDYLGLDQTRVARDLARSAKPALRVKPILKHRSLSDILSVPSSGAASPIMDGNAGSFSGSDMDDYEGYKDEDPDSAFDSSGTSSSAEGTPRGNGSQTPKQYPREMNKSKSDTALVHQNQQHQPYRRKKPSPSRAEIIATHSATRTRNRTGSVDAGDYNTHHTITGPQTPTQESYDEAFSDVIGVNSSSPTLANKRSFSHDSHNGDPSAHNSQAQANPNYHQSMKKRHITFNHRVDQCISVDVDEDQAARNRAAAAGVAHKSDGGLASKTASSGRSQPYSNSLQRYGSSSSGPQTSSSSSSGSSSDSDTTDEEEDVLTFKSSSPRSPSFVKPFLASPTDPNNPLSADSIRFKNGHGRDQYQQEKQEPYTIARMEPTTLKESELLPGPTPIVVMEDGRVTALYGTEDDYIFDAAEHGGMDISDWAERIREVSEEEATEGESEIVALLEHSDIKGSVNDGDAVLNDSDHYNPAQATTTTVDSHVFTSPSGYENQDSSINVNSAKDIVRSKEDYFSGTVDMHGNEYDQAQITNSQSNYKSGAIVNDSAYRGTSVVQPQASNLNPTLTSPATSSPSFSPGIETSMLLSSSPSGKTSVAPTKSILKKNVRDQNTTGEFYPLLPPASTRASRAHAAMFTEDGEENPAYSSPKSQSVSLPGKQQKEGTDNAPGESNTSVIPSPSSNSPALASTSNTITGYTEPARGRSISRGSSSSSLVDRGTSGQSVNSDFYPINRTRSTSGTSLSPVSSYSPPYTSSLNSLGTGMAVMQSQPVDIPRGRTRGVPSTKPSNRRTVLYSSSDEEDGSSTEEEEEEDQQDHDNDENAADMDVQLDTVSENCADVKPGNQKDEGVHFTRQAAQAPSPSRSAGSSVSSSTRREDNRNSQNRHVEQAGFEKRSTSPAANVDRSIAGIFPRPSSAQSGNIPARAANVSAPSSSTSISSPSSLSSPLPVGRVREDRNDKAGEGEGETGADDDEEEEEEKLFDSPYMPSSPIFSSGTNLPALATMNGGKAASSSMSSSSERGRDPYQVRWADHEPAKAEVKSSAARSSLLRNLSPPSSMKKTSYSHSASTSTSANINNNKQQQPAYKSSIRSKHARSLNDNNDEDELSDPANNGYSYGYGFDLSEDDEDENASRGVVGRAVDLVGALWNVGSGMLWKHNGTTASQ